jgi:hypothetical protein
MKIPMTCVYIDVNILLCLICNLNMIQVDWNMNVLLNTVFYGMYDILRCQRESELFIY